MLGVWQKGFYVILLFFILVEISAFSSGSHVEDFNQTINFHDYLQDCISKDVLIDGLQSGTSSRTEQFWLMRESITYASAKDGPQVKHDISIPISKIPKFVDWGHIRSIFRNWYYQKKIFFQTCWAEECDWGQSSRALGKGCISMKWVEANVRAFMKCPL